MGAISIYMPRRCFQFVRLCIRIRNHHFHNLALRGPLVPLTGTTGRICRCRRLSGHWGKGVREMAQMCALCALGFLPGGNVASHRRKNASGWASVCEPGCARLPRWGAARSGRIRTVKSAGAPLADGVGSGVGSTAIGSEPGQRRWLCAGNGSRLGEQLFRTRFYLSKSREFGRCRSPGFLS
jgi:hypothetical protein